MIFRIVGNKVVYNSTPAAITINRMTSMRTGLFRNKGRISATKIVQIDKIITRGISTQRRSRSKRSKGNSTVGKSFAILTPQNKKVRSRSHALKKCTTPNAATHLLDAKQVQKVKVHFSQSKMRLLAEIFRCVAIS